MKIEKIEIKGLFGKKDICWELNPQVNVLVGENGSGKSTILSIMHDLLLIQANEKNIPLFDSAKITFQNQSETEYVPTEKVIEKTYYEKPNDLKSPSLLKLLLLGATGLGVGSILSVASTVVGLAAVSTAVAVANTANSDEPNKINTENKLYISKVIQGVSNKENLYIDLIAANLTNSNANHIIQKSNQIMGTVLDMEIRDTIYKIHKIDNPELINQLSGSLNFFFNQIGKQVTYENDKWVYTDTQLQKTLNYSDLSSGERQLIYILLRVALSNDDKSKTAIILMDEPEISLHLNWQEHFIKQLTILNPDAQFIIVTHSPALIMNGWNDVYVDMAEITRDMEQAQS